MARCPTCGKRVETPIKERNLGEFVLSNTSVAEKENLHTGLKLDL